MNRSVRSFDVRNPGRANRGLHPALRLMIAVLAVVVLVGAGSLALRGYKSLDHAVAPSLKSASVGGSKSGVARPTPKSAAKALRISG